MSSPERRAASTSTDGTLTRDEVFDVLSSRRRRNVIHALRDAGGETTVGDLSRQLAAWENDHEDVSSVSAKERKRVYTALRQTHLPKLDEVGVVEYDPDRGTVTLSHVATDLYPYLRVPELQRWPLYYGSVAALALLAIGAAAVGFLPSSIGSESVAVVACVLVFLLAAGHYLSVRPAQRDRIALLVDTVPSVNGDANRVTESEED